MGATLKTLGPQYDDKKQNLTISEDKQLIKHDNDYDVIDFTDEDGIAYTSKVKRLHINVNIQEDLKVKGKVAISGEMICLTGVAQTSFTAPLFIGIATGALCCPDYVFDQYFDKKCEIPNYKILNIDETMDFAKTNRHLPTIKTNRSNIKEKQLNINELVLNLWETVETQAIHIKELNDRIKILEEKVNS